MHRVVIDEPYEFVPPYKGTFIARMFRFYLRTHMRKADGITESDVRGIEHLKSSISAEHGILLCPNHCRPSDPMAMGLVNGLANCHTHSMASWHVFKQSWLQSFITRQLGAFSIYREGMDRLALNTAVDIVTEADRPLIVFPEGAISRCNDRLLALMDGTAFIARTAAKKRQKIDPAKKVVIHPVALRYEFKGDIEAAVTPVLGQIERRLSWSEKKSDDIYTRIRRIGGALLGLKEFEYTHRIGEGGVYDRLESLINTILVPHETEWLGGQQDGTVVSRVKSLRSAILPDMVNKELPEAERDRRWGQLTDVYIAQQLSSYPPGYVDENSPPERVLETVERFEEDLTDKCKLYTPIKLYMQIGEAIEVEVKRPRGEADPVMTQLRDQLTGMIDSLGQEIADRRSAGSA